MLFIPVSSGATADEIAVTHNAFINNADDEIYMLSGSVDQSLPSLDEMFDLMLDSMDITAKTHTYTTQYGQYITEEGILFYTGYNVKTKGQLNVAAMSVDDAYDFNDEEKAHIFSGMSATYDIEVLGDPTYAYNCHSYAWHSSSTSNHYWIDDITNYLCDLHTVRIPYDEICVGDIAVYVDSNRYPLHSAIISEINGSEIICRSKWGANVLCEHNIGCVPRDYWASDSAYSCCFFRVTPHSFNYESCGSKQHTRECTTCNYTIQEYCTLSYTSTESSVHNAHCDLCGNVVTENCEITYFSLGALYHYGKCLDCSYRTDASSCTFTYSFHSSKKHTKTCTLCGYTATESCELESNYAGSGTHLSACQLCGIDFFESCTSTLTHFSDDTLGDIHRPACQECQNPMGGTPEACTFEYIYDGTVDGNNVHSYVCTECKYVKISKALCWYKNSNTCITCGWTKDIGSDTILKRVEIADTE